MPIYEYYCQSCGHEAEIMHKMSDPEATDCPECRQPSLTKMVSAAGFRLGGGGWYETDFKAGNKKNLAGDGGDSGASCKPGGCEKPGCAAPADKPAASTA